MAGFEGLTLTLTYMYPSHVLGVLLKAGLKVSAERFMAARLTLTLTDRREGKVSEAAMFQNYYDCNCIPVLLWQLTLRKNKFSNGPGLQPEN